MLALLRSVVRRLVLPAGLCLLAGCAGNITPEFYERLSANLMSKGHLRTDIAPADAPFGVAELTRSFGEIAFSYEFGFDDRARLVPEPLDKPLKRWRGTVRYRVVGDAVTTADTAEIARLTARLAELTGLDFRRVEGAHDMLISIAGPDGRPAIADLLDEIGLNVHRARYQTWQRTADWVCGATLSSAQDDPMRLVYAHVFLRAEVTGVMRRGCLHEEIAQSLGLSNDSDRARPSIFNDDHEFATLTAHDALLLRALYDRRLEAGMDRRAALPIARRIFSDLLDQQTALGTDRTTPG